jgi:hypothetical protein
MRTVILGLAIAAATFGSNSFHMVDGTQAFNFPTTPTNFSSICTIHWEGSLTTAPGQALARGLVSYDSAESVSIDAADYVGWGGPGFSTTLQIPVGGLTQSGGKVSFRWVAQRIGSGACTSGVIALTVIDQVGGSIQSFTGTFTASGRLDRSFYKLFVGQMYSGHSGVGDVGFLRGYSTSQGLAGSYVPDRLKTTGKGDYFNYEFEQSGTTQPVEDAGQYALTFSIVSYVTTVTYAPIAAVPPSTAHTVKAGSTVSIDGSVSFSNVDNPAVTCAWSATGAGGSFSAASVCATTFTPTVNVFGTRTISLTVTDASSNTATSTIKLGAVVTDANDGIIMPTATAADRQMKAIIGPMIMFGSPKGYGYLDDRNIYMADAIGKGIQSLWPQPWNTPVAGATITVQKGSNVVTGSGVNFLTDGSGCTGGVSNAHLIVFYPSLDYPGTFGRALYDIANCTNSTLTLDKVFIHASNTTAIPNLQYTIMQGNDLAYTNFIGVLQITTINYYDNVLAWLRLYFRTGLDVYLGYARTLADIVWTSPWFDRGYAWQAVLESAPPWGMERRKFNLVGLMARAIDPSDPHPEMWTGLHHVWTWEKYLVDTFTGGALSDHREQGLAALFVGHCAVFDNDPSWRAFCSNLLAQINTRLLGVVPERNTGRERNHC